MLLLWAVSWNYTYVLMTFMMNYKCQPVYLEQAINVLTWMLLVEERSRFYGLNFPWVTNISDFVRVKNDSCLFNIYNMRLHCINRDVAWKDFALFFTSFSCLKPCPDCFGLVFNECLTLIGKIHETSKRPQSSVDTIELLNNGNAGIARIAIRAR